ncbi:hypothetical protein Q8F55_006894 [Vanrija albida]|uniref:Alpha/beta hydrolase fold-3 domain-containing protein n=1 Tax=Vanrija albida TaxID=181172 RepID=A0ABR3PYV0_9TREE
MGDADIDPATAAVLEAVSTDSTMPPPPLATETYPLQFDPGARHKGYWLTMALVALVWSVTPLSFLYVLWYILYARHFTHRVAWAASTGVTVYAFVEVAFACYLFYLGRKVQAPGLHSSDKLDTISDMFIRTMLAGKNYTPSPEGRARALSGAAIRDAQDRARAFAAAAGGSTALKTPLTPGWFPHKMNLGLTSPQLRRRTPLPGDEGGDYLSAGAQHDKSDFEKELDAEVDALFNEYGDPYKLDVDDPRAVETREHFRMWFEQKPWDSLRKDDILLWLSWAAFGVDIKVAQADPKRVRFLNRTYKMIEARTGTVFPEGRSDVNVMRQSMDPVNAVGRPFIIYAFANVVNWWLINVVYPWRGARIYREGDIDLIVRIPPGWTPEKGRTERNALPIVYLHGLGFGMLQNHLLVHHLVGSLPTHPLLIPIPHYTSQAIFHKRFLRPWSRTEFTSAIKSACERWGFWTEGVNGEPDQGGVSMLSHSNGSVHHGWILKDVPSLTRRNTFVDPVVFCLWEGDVCFNFCYRKPSKPIHLLLYYFIASEVGIANYIQRNFVWTDNTLFLEDIPHARDPTKTAFFIGGEDIIINADRTRRYLERHGVTTGLHWDPEAGHGDGLIGEARDRVVMYVGTGSTRGCEGWLTRGRRSHSVGEYGRPPSPPESTAATPAHGTR